MTKYIKKEKPSTTLSTISTRQKIALKKAA